jgi:hypothetical protein
MNRIGDEGIEIFSKVLRENISLITLSLRSNQITSKGINSTLEVLVTCTKNTKIKNVFL